MKLGKDAAEAATAFVFRQSGIPSPHAANAVSVTDGTYCAGTVVESGGSHFAFDAAGVLVGEYDSGADAVRALPLVECDIVGGVS